MRTFSENKTKKSQKRTFSIVGPNLNFETITIPVGEKLTRGGLVGTLLNSVLYAHVLHLSTNNYEAHIALQQYYEGIPAWVDALAESFINDNTAMLLMNHIVPVSECPIEYLTAVKNLITTPETDFEFSDSQKSTLDAIVEYLDSILFKLTRLQSIAKSFSKITSEEDFRKYAHTVMKAAHGENYSEEVTDKVVDDLIKNNPDADYGELIGRMTSNFSKRFSLKPVKVEADSERVEKLTQKVKDSFAKYREDPTKKNAVNNQIAQLELQQAKIVLDSKSNMNKKLQTINDKIDHLKESLN